MSGKLFVVGTPIGNLQDFSPRGIETLKNADFIAAEDTRVTMKLLNHFDFKKEMVSYYEHNKNERGNLIIERILNGETCALVSDAGMPAISDPGEELVKTARENGIEIEAVPGPSAVITALSISGMPSRRFCFEGFLSANKNERKAHLQEIKNEKRTLIFYEAPHKLVSTLKDLYAFFGDRKVSVVKELTKIHETVLNATLSEAYEYYNENTPKGEFVIIVEGKEEQKTEYTLTDAINIAEKLIAEGQAMSSAAKEAAAITGIKKGDIYKAVLK
jgi:16S rRNA (cytidine1402-2'-O)-methyltransferase